MNASIRLQALMERTRALVAATPDLRTFMGDSLAGRELRLPEPRDLPVTALLRGLVGSTAGSAAGEVAAAVIAAAPDLAWLQSYSEAEVGAHYLARYGWFNLVGPDGPYLSDAVRVSVGYWHGGLTYRRHWHEPEEIYCILAGGARFLADGRAPREAGAGELVHHPSNLPHSMDMHSAPLLAMAFWRGGGLTDKPGIDVAS